MRIETINCGVVFNSDGCARLREALDAGKAVRIYIDAIGHTHTAMVTDDYAAWLRSVYGDRLERVTDYAVAFRVR